MSTSLRARNVFLAATATMLALAACSGTGASGKNTAGEGEEAATIALLLPETITPRYEKIERPVFTERLKEICPECELITANANSDPDEQLRQTEDAISQGAQVIVTNPVDSNAAAGMAARASEAGVPLISLGRLIQNGDVAWSLTMDTVQAGRDKALALVEALKAQGNPNGPIVMINGAPGDTDDANMKKGAKEVFEENGVGIALEYDTPSWDPAQAQAEMDQAITELGRDGFYGVYSSNDGMAGGVIAALKSAGIDPSTRPVTGLDNDVAALQRIVAGEQYMTEFQGVADEATKAAEIALMLARGEEVPDEYQDTTVNNGAVDVPTYLFEIGPITRENIKEYFDRGAIDASEVCVDVYAAHCEELGIEW
jgi:D-xylose transport system substrate-binding protein